MACIDTPRERKVVRLLALDLDDTVRHGKTAIGYFENRPDKVTVFPEAVSLMRRWKHPDRTPGRIIGISNQGGIAMGHTSPKEVEERFLLTMEKCDDLFDRIMWCPHYPSEDPATRCWCRKPSPGLLVHSIIEMGRIHNETYPPHMGLFVGDRPEDEECAKLAGFPFTWADEWRASA